MGAEQAIDERTADEGTAHGTRSAGDSPRRDGRRPPGVELIGGPTTSSWREGALTRAAELEVLAEWFARREDEPEAVLVDRIRSHLATARQAAEGRPPRNRRFRFAAMVAGSPHERTASNIDAAETDLLRLAPDDYVCGQMPSLLAHVRAHLPVNDPRRARMEELAAVSRHRPLRPVERNMLVSVVRASQSESRREVMRVRSFRNVLYIATVLMTLAAIGLTVITIARPEALPLCFTPQNKVVCPTSEAAVPRDQAVDPILRREADAWDIVTVELLGLIAAAVASAIALRNIRGTTTPYSLPVALALLKLPTGALTAVLGLLLMRGQFVPGLSALDTSAQILSWAIVFGYAQQVFTRFVDERAHAVLDQVGSPTTPDARAGAPSTITVTTAWPELDEQTTATEGANGQPPRKADGGQGTPPTGSASPSPDG